MLSECQARKAVGKKLRIILPVTTFYTDENLCGLFFFRWGKYSKKCTELSASVLSEN